MNKLNRHKVWLNTLKKTSVLFLVFALLFIQIPDAFWQQLHTHEHHDCGKIDVVHAYTFDCNFEQRFILPWNNDLIKQVNVVVALSIFIINIPFISRLLYSNIPIINNKSPPISENF